jgi:hypothetical protein
MINNHHFVDDSEGNSETTENAFTVDRRLHSVVMGSMEKFSQEKWVEAYLTIMFRKRADRRKP